MLYFTNINNNSSRYQCTCKPRARNGRVYRWLNFIGGSPYIVHFGEVSPNDKTFRTHALDATYYCAFIPRTALETSTTRVSSVITRSWLLRNLPESSLGNHHLICKRLHTVNDALSDWDEKMWLRPSLPNFNNIQL